MRVLPLLTSVLALNLINAKNYLVETDDNKKSSEVPTEKQVNTMLHRSYGDDKKVVRYVICFVNM